MSKNFIKLFLIFFIILAIVGIGGYFILVQKSEVPGVEIKLPPTQEKESAKTSEKIPEAENKISPPREKEITKSVEVDWQSLIPSIKTSLQQAFPERIFTDQDIRISKTVDITSDGLPEALIQIECGATTCELVLMQLENNKPVAARFKEKNGEISYLVFIYGAGGAGRYGFGTELKEDKNAVYFTRYSAYNMSDDFCEAEVYQWNPQTKIFEFNPSLSKEASEDYCSKICSDKMVVSDPNFGSYFQRICH